MIETNTTGASRPSTPPGPRPSVYVILKVIGCRIHYAAVNGGWTSYVNHWTRSWVSTEREEAYQSAKAAGGLLVRWTQAEWAALLDSAVNQEPEHDDSAGDVQP